MKRTKELCTMKCSFMLVTVFIISVESAPYISNPEHWTQTNMQMEQLMLNQIAQQSLEQWIMQDQYSSIQQQLMALHHMHAMESTQYGPVPYKLPQQPILILVPSAIAKTTNRLENRNENYKPDFKLGVGDNDAVVINAENEENIPERNIVPQRAVVLLPNGQRLIIGSIISAIPFLPFEVNVPDTIGWIYNGIAGIIGGIGQRLPFRPRPTTASPVQQTQEPIPPSESMTPNQGSIMPGPETDMMPTQESNINLMQKLISRRPNVGLPILMLPVTQTVPIQVPIQV